MYEDEELLMLSALQHFIFCERQCALIHIEQQWAENVYTIQGELLHKRVHSGTSEKRPGRRKEFGMPVRSLELGLTGKTDAVEYLPGGGICIVEYKRGKPKKGLMDETQLCAQAICMEEMTGKQIDAGALFYGKQKRRKDVAFTEELRRHTRETTDKLHTFIREGRTPPPAYDKGKCPRCSLKNICLPKKMDRKRPVAAYYTRMLKEDEEI